MNYDELIIALEKIHLYPTRKRMKKDKCLGLEIDTSPLLQQDRKAWIEQHIPECKVEWMGNGETNEYLLLTVK